MKNICTCITKLKKNTYRMNDCKLHKPITMKGCKTKKDKELCI